MEWHNADLWFDPGDFICRLWRHWIFVLPSPPASPERLAMAGRREGQKNNKNRLDPVDPVEKVPPQAAKSFCSKKGAVEKCPTQ